LRKASHRQVDGPREPERDEDAGDDRQQHAAAVNRGRMPGAALDNGARNADADHPARLREARERRVHGLALDGVREPGAFQRPLVYHRLEARCRLLREVLRVARSCDALVLRVEDGNHPVARDALALDELDEGVGADRGCQHVAQLSAALHRHPYRYRPLAARAAGEVADRRPAFAHRLLEALPIGNQRQRALRKARIHELRAVRERQDHRTPMGLRHERALGTHQEGGEIVVVEQRRGGEHFEHRRCRGEAPRRRRSRARA
jgi:hypothetical protein